MPYAVPYILTAYFIFLKFKLIFNIYLIEG